VKRFPSCIAPALPLLLLACNAPDDADTPTEPLPGDTGAADSGGPDSGDTSQDPETGETGSPPADDGWPSRFFAPYVDATAYPTLKIADASATNGARFYVLGFVVAASATRCEATWGTYSTIEAGPSAWEGGSEYTLYDQVAALRAQGGDVMVSLGGAVNTPIEAACGTVEEVVAEYERLLDTLSLTRIDFDVEGAWQTEAVSLERRSRAIAELQARRAASGTPLHVWFTLPVLPSGLTAEGLGVLESALAHGVDVAGVNVMTMNYGDGTAPDPDGRMGQYAVDAVTSLHAQLDALYGGARSDAELWAMIGSTPMIGQNDVSSEVFYATDASVVRAHAEDVGMGMLSMWSANRDRPCAERTEWARSDCHGLTDVAEWDYARVFAGYGE
jgi:bifunctional chitinase/lysozyme